ncbi:uncharacterized protein LOC125061483 isoform X1 [Pieris napi]|uniref:uncharacterized protein LOC125061483 isoform X1 n=2 Tax=Pieris napi TaxID=78633 RepID=UPI001FBBD8D9|nr:uncharacterized protein LOC125061483 isoform X1 [Pieris napi]
MYNTKYKIIMPILKSVKSIKQRRNINKSKLQLCYIAQYTVMFLVLLLIQMCNGLWRNGIIHYNIYNKDYDLHSQDEIMSTLSKLQEEICLKFFMTPSYNMTNEKILYISNPDKLKTCSSPEYDFSKDVVYLPIGYKCINQKDIARLVIDMIRASIQNSVSPVNSYDLVRRTNEFEESNRQSLMSTIDRNYINTHYYEECGESKTPKRRSGVTSKLTKENLNYYKGKVWPLGVVMYGIEEDLRGTVDHNVLSFSMASIELSTCVVFQEISHDDDLSPKNLVWFGKRGQDIPLFGFGEGNRTLKLSSIVNGVPGHKGHTINNLMRILGVHMTSNRYDRDNYVTINWNKVEMGKEHYLEKAPEESWLAHIPYDFDSVTHAPANYMCNACELGATTVQPIQDHLWQRTMSMGHKTVLTDADIETVNIIYSEECRGRFGKHDISI